MSGKKGSSATVVTKTRRAAASKKGRMAIATAPAVRKRPARKRVVAVAQGTAARVVPSVRGALPELKGQARLALGEIVRSEEMSPGVEAMLGRAGDFRDRDAAMLAGIAVHPASRARLDAALDDLFTGRDVAADRTDGWDEVVVGGGLHAAIYCAVRAARGFPRPLVLEGSDRVGGAMACGPFYLNSRNRRGGLGVPGSSGALNVLPGAPIQPSDISGDEYQRSDDLAFIARLTLAMRAEVATGCRVATIGYSDDDGGMRYEVLLLDGRKVRANRVVLATGLGDPKARHDHPNLLTFNQFMGRCAGEPFPMRGVRRLAVVGCGDGGRTAVEAACGQGAGRAWSVASLDTPETVDWYGVDEGALTRATWEGCNRSRYKGIGRLLPRATGLASPVTPTAMAAGNLAGGFESAYVGAIPYDLVVDCRGFKGDSIETPWELAAQARGGLVVGRRAVSEGVYQVGPAADLEVETGESELAENRVGLFRYAGRTAALAAALGAPGPPDTTG